VRLGKESPIEYIDTKEAKKQLKAKREEGFEVVLFDGGEPTLRNDLVELLVYAKEQKYSEAQVLTNGMVLADEAVVKKFTNIKEGPEFKLTFSVSLHSHDKNISDKLTSVPGAYDKTIAGIKNLIKNKFSKISLYSIITEHNYQQLEQYVDFVNDKFPEIKNITFSFMYPAGAAKENIDLYPRLSKVEPCFYKALDKCKKYGINFSITTCGTIPLCFLKGYEHLLINQQELDAKYIGLLDSSQDGGFELASEDFHKKTKVKGPQCLDCDYYEKCGGIWSLYVDKYGLEELRPVRKSNKANKVLLLLTGFSCNNNCIICSNLSDRRGNRSTEEIKQEIEKGKDEGYLTIEFIGGEPTIRPDFKDLVSTAKDFGYRRICVTTNGRLFSYKKFARDAKETGLNSIVFSLYGHTDQIHNGITRTPGSFAECVSGIKNVLELGYPSVAVNTVIVRPNLKYLNEMIDLLIELGVLEWHLLELLPDGQGLEFYNLLNIRLDELADTLEKNKDNFKKLKSLHIFDYPFCVIGPDLIKQENVQIVTPKIRLEDIHQRAGDMKSTRVKTSQNKDEKIYHDKYKTKPPVCTSCIYFAQCGGITNLYYQEHGDAEIKKLFKKHKLHVRSSK
jgi:cyclic pyranopterin phosphate synthase